MSYNIEIEVQGPWDVDACVESAKRLGWKVLSIHENGTPYQRLDWEKEDEPNA